MIIFVTVGSALPFDRLISEMDKWSAEHPDADVFAQIGDGKYLPKNMQYKRIISPDEFRQRSEGADVIVAHAGMGSVITASELGKPIVLLPRLASAREHTTDHQLHTAGWLRGKQSIFVADTNDNLGDMIEAALLTAAGTERLASFAPAELTDRLRAAILGAD